MRALIELDIQNAETVAAALGPDLGAERFTTKLKPAGRTLAIEITAQSIGELTAGLNSCLRLVRTATATQEVK